MATLNLKSIIHRLPMLPNVTTIWEEKCVKIKATVNYLPTTLFLQVFQTTKLPHRILDISWSCWPAPRPVVWTTNESVSAIFLDYVSAPPTRLVYPPPPAQTRPRQMVMKYEAQPSYCAVIYYCSHLDKCLLFLLALISSTDTNVTPSLYSHLEASAEQPEGDDVFFDMLVKCQVRTVTVYSMFHLNLMHVFIQPEEQNSNNKPEC